MRSDELGPGELEQLRAAWREIVPPALDRDDASADPHEAAAIAWMRTAWKELNVAAPVPARPGRPALRAPRRFTIPLARAAAAILVVGLLLVVAWERSAPPGRLVVDALPDVAPSPGVGEASRPSAANDGPGPPVGPPTPAIPGGRLGDAQVDVRPDGIEIRTPGLRLILLDRALAAAERPPS